MTLTRDEAATLLDRCTAFRRGELSVEDLQSALALAITGTQSVEQHELRDLLSWAEGQIDMIRATRDADERAAAALPVVERIENPLRSVQSE